MAARQHGPTGWKMICPPSRVIGNQEIEPADKKRKAGQQVRPLHTELRTKYDNNNEIIPHVLTPASHQFWGQIPNPEKGSRSIWRLCYRPCRNFNHGVLI